MEYRNELDKMEKEINKITKELNNNEELTLEDLKEAISSMMIYAEELENLFQEYLEPTEKYMSDFEYVSTLIKDVVEYSKDKIASIQLAVRVA